MENNQNNVIYRIRQQIWNVGFLNQVLFRKFIITILSDTDNCNEIAKFACQAFEDRETALEVLATIQDMVNFTEKTCIANTSPPNAISAKSDSYMIKSTANDGMRITLARVF